MDLESMPQAALQRAYSLLNVKAVDDERRVITGMATTPDVDRQGHIVDPFGVRFKNPLPLLLYHDNEKPVGTVTFGKATKDGIPFEATLPVITEPGTLRDRVAEAWQSVKAGLIKGVSIGWLPLEDGIEFVRETGILLLKAIEVFELSLVTVPANAEATIRSIKSFDAPYLAPLGLAGRTSFHTPAAVGTVRVSTRQDRSMKKTIAEQVAGLQAQRLEKHTAFEAIQQKALDEGRTKDAQEKDDFDKLKVEIKAIDDEVADLQEMEKLQVKQAAPVLQVAGQGQQAAAEARGAETVIRVKETLPPGMGFARAVKAQLVARLDGRNVLDVAKEMYPHDDRLHKHLNHIQALPNIIMRLKAAVPSATLANDLWAGALVDPTNLPGEFVEFLRPATIIGRLNLRSVPTNVRLIEQTQGGTGYWVGVGAPKPLTAFGYAPITLNPTKVAAIAVATEESLRYSSPSLDMLIRDGLRDALVERVDRDLLDPAEAGTANIQPASLTNGLSALSSAGTSADNIRTDIGKLVRTLRTNNLRGPIAIVLPDSLLTAMAWMVNSLGQAEFPGLMGEGGTFNGVRFIGSEYVANASGAGNMVVAIAEREVFKSDDGGVRVDASREASLQMLDNPTNNSATATATQMVSMWQTNSVAFRGEWFINWQKRRSTAVAFIDDANWGSVGSPQ